MAAICGATVLPCLLTAAPGFRVTLRLAEPVPESLVSDYRQHPAARMHLHRALVPWLQAHPEQCYPVLTDVLRPIEPPGVYRPASRMSRTP
jgi:hypothetical protein